MSGTELEQSEVNARMTLVTLVLLTLTLVLVTLVLVKMTLVLGLNAA